MKGKPKLLDTSRIKIERGIPLPTKTSPNLPKTGVSALYRRMKPGDSVLVPVKSARSISHQARAIFGAGNWRCRREPGGVRVWRMMDARATDVFELLTEVRRLLARRRRR